VALVHGQDELRRVQAASAALFGAGELTSLDEATLRAALAEAPSVRAAADEPLVVDLLAEALGLSKSQARQAVKDGGAYVNNAPVRDVGAVVGEQDWLHGRFAVLRRGKKAMAVAERA
jgi:tyrosyl-tRNA synthetase